MCVGGYFLLNIDCVIFSIVVVDLSPLMRKFAVYSTDLSRFTLYPLLHSDVQFLAVYVSAYSEFITRMYCSVDT